MFPSEKAKSIGMLRFIDRAIVATTGWFGSCTQNGHSVSGLFTCLLCSGEGRNQDGLPPLGHFA